MNRPILTLHKQTDDEPGNLRFIERSKRYILQELVTAVSQSATVSFRWRDVPLVRIT